MVILKLAIHLGGTGESWGEGGSTEQWGRTQLDRKGPPLAVLTLGANKDPGSFWDQSRLLPGPAAQAALGFSAGVPRVGGMARG